jgi:hypothetical protein
MQREFADDRHAKCWGRWIDMSGQPSPDRIRDGGKRDEKQSQDRCRICSDPEPQIRKLICRGRQRNGLNNEGSAEQPGDRVHVSEETASDSNAVDCPHCCEGPGDNFRLPSVSPAQLCNGNAADWSRRRRRLPRTSANLSLLGWQLEDCSPCDITPRRRVSISAAAVRNRERPVVFAECDARRDIQTAPVRARPRTCGGGAPGASP